MRPKFDMVDIGVIIIRGKIRGKTIGRTMRNKSVKVKERKDSHPNIIWTTSRDSISWQEFTRCMARVNYASEHFVPNIKRSKAQIEQLKLQYDNRYKKPDYKDNNGPPENPV